MKLGNITFINDDCMNVLRNLPDNAFDLAIVDPPYGINTPNMKMGEHNGNESTATKFKKGRLNQGSGKLKNRALNTMPLNWDYSTPDKEYFEQLFRVSCNQIICGGNYFELGPTRGIVCWDKMQPWENFSQVELIWTSFDYPAKIVKISTTGGANAEVKIHPTQKPVALYKWLLTKYAKQGDKILDTHLGSGSTLLAASQCNRKAYGFEIKKDFVNASLKYVLKSIDKQLLKPNDPRITI